MDALCVYHTLRNSIRKNFGVLIHGKNGSKLEITKKSERRACMEDACAPSLTSKSLPPFMTFPAPELLHCHIAIA